MYSSPLTSKKCLLLFFLISLLPLTLSITRFSSPDSPATLEFLILRFLFFLLIFIIALILFLLFLISLLLLPFLPVFHRALFLALSSSVSKLLLLLISCLIPLFLFIYMLMTHNSIFIFPLLISSLVFLLSLLLSILSTIGFLPIVFPLIHQKLNSSSLVPPSSVSNSPPFPSLFDPPFFLQLLTVETLVSCSTVNYPSTSISLPFALLLSITFANFVRSALFSIALPQFSLPMLSFPPNSTTAILFFLVSLFIPFGDSSLSKTLLPV